MKLHIEAFLTADRTVVVMIGNHTLAEIDCGQKSPADYGSRPYDEAEKLLIQDVAGGWFNAMLRNIHDHDHDRENS